MNEQKLLTGDIAPKETCTHHNCQDRAVTIVYWPGKTPPPRYCDEHAAMAKRVLAAMGTPVHTEPIQ